jgi:hypothetical protein
VINKKFSPNKPNKNFKPPDFIESLSALFSFPGLMASGAALITGFIILLCVNHATSTIKEQVTATVIDRSYTDPWDEQQPIYTTDSKGNQILVGFNHIHHDPEWHVTWGYRGLNYTASTYSNWGGWVMGAKREMVIRIGGIFKSEYLWPE